MFDHYCHGGFRDKSTMWWSNRDWFLSLSQRCDKSHNHAKWNPEVIDGKMVFPKDQEASYPILLCQRLAAIIKDHAFSMGAHDVTNLRQQLEETSMSGHRFILGMLPRGKKFKPLVSEYGAYQSTQHEKVLQTLPKGSKILHRRLQRGVLRDNAILPDGSDKPKLKEDLDIAELNDYACYNSKTTGIHDSPFNGIHCDKDGSCNTFEVLTIGIPRDPMDFVEKAVKAGHPRSMSVNLPTVVQAMLRENFEQSPLVLMKKRTAFFWKWTKRAKELIAEEAKYKSTLPSHLQNLRKKKKLLLWAEILKSLDYPDSELILHVAKGFQISGWLPESNVFPKETRRPEYDLETVKKMAVGLNKAIMQQTMSQNRDDTVDATWNATLDELERGWVFLDSVTNIDSHLVARRFGLRQKEKIRVIDDCTIGGFNRTTGSREKLKLHSIDELSVYLLDHVEHPGFLYQGLVWKDLRPDFCLQTIWCQCCRQRDLENPDVKCRARRAGSFGHQFVAIRSYGLCEFFPQGECGSLVHWC